MKNFRFKISRKVTVWQNEYFTISANSRKRAIELAKLEIDEPSGEYNTDLEFDFESAEDMTVEENDGWSTIELFDDETGETLYENGTNIVTLEQNIIDFGNVKVKDTL